MLVITTADAGLYRIQRDAIGESIILNELYGSAGHTLRYTDEKARLGVEYTYRIIPLDTAIADWKSFGLSDASLKEAKASYNRTLELVGTGINAARVKLSLAEMPLSIN